MSNPSVSVAGRITLLTGSVLAISQGSLLAAGLAVIRQEYATITDSSLLVRAMLFSPALAMAVSGPFVGHIADRNDKRRMLALSLSGFSIAGVCLYMTTSIQGLILGRLALGFLLACTVAASTSLIAEYYSSNDRARWLGWQTAAVGAAGAGFPIIGGYLASLDWRLTFLLYLVVSPCAFAALRLPIVEVSRSELTEALDLSSVWDLYGLAFLAALTINLLTVQIAFHLASLGWSSTLLSGAALSVSALTCAIFSLHYGTFRARFGFNEINSAAFALIALGYLLIAVGTTQIVIGVGLACAGVGFGLNIPNTTTWLLSRVHARVRGRAIALLTTAVYGAQFACLFLYEGIGRTFGSGATFLFGAGVAALGVVTSLLRPAKPASIGERRG